MRARLLPLLRDVVAGFAAYTLARWIWGPPEGAFTKLHLELLTFAAIYVLLQVLLRGWRYARQGKVR